jgi:hypothetical protein
MTLKLYQPEGHSIPTNAKNMPYQTSKFDPNGNRINYKQSAATTNTLRTQSESESMDRNTIDNNMVLKTKPVHHQRGTPTNLYPMVRGVHSHLHLARGYTFSHMRLPYLSSKGAGRHFYFYSNHSGEATATQINFPFANLLPIA